MTPGNPADTASLDPLRQRLMADPAAQDALAPVEIPQAFAQGLVERGLAPAQSAGQIVSALGADPLGIDRFGATPVTSQTCPGAHFLPVAVTSDGGQPVVEWAHFAGRALREPFYEESLRRARFLPLNRLVRWRTPLAALTADPHLAAVPAPDGFIFHMSRCGSTLVAQMLAAIEGAVVVSEAPPLDAVLQIARQQAGLGPARQVAPIRAMVAALTAGHAGVARHRFVKLDCWHTLALPLLRAAFPETPWIFLHRDPLAVLRSHQRMPGSQTVPGMMPQLFSFCDAGALSRSDYTARVLAMVCDAAAEHFPLGGGLIIDYAALPGALRARIMPHFGATPDPRAADSMTDVARFDAKSPGMPFDPNEHAPAPTEALSASAQAYLAEPLARLKRLAASG